MGVPRCTANSANSTVNDAGELEVNGNREKAGCISALSPVTGTHHIALSYESTADSSQQTSIGVMEVWDQEEVIASTKLMSDQTSAVIKDLSVNGRSLSIHIRISSGVVCRLQSLRFTKLSLCRGNQLQ